MSQLSETFNAQLVEARLISPRVRHLTFERIGAPFHFAAGQWVSVVFPFVDEKGKPVRRSYSIASASEDGGRFELVVTRVEGGPGSTFLHDAAVGATMEVRGPQGMFERSGAVPSLFIATGTGVAPFRRMLRDALETHDSSPLWVLFGARTQSDLLFGEELQALEARHPNVRFMPSLSRPEPGWSGLSGYVQTHVTTLWRELGATSATPPHAYVCGVKKMLLEVRAVLKEQLGVERQRIHVESYD